MSEPNKTDPIKPIQQAELNKGFQKDLEDLINKYNLEFASGIPDYALAKYLIDCLAALNGAAQVKNLFLE